MKRANGKNEEKMDRKTSKKVGKLLEKYAGNEKNVVHGLMATDGITASQYSAYEKGQAKNSDGNYFQSQEALLMFQNGFTSDADDSD